MSSIERPGPPKLGRAERRLVAVKAGLDERAQQRARPQVEATKSPVEKEPAERQDEERLAGLVPKRFSRWLSTAAKVGFPVALATILALQSWEAARIDTASASKLGPTPAEVPTPERAAEEMARLGRTIEKINQEPGVAMGPATPTATEIQPKMSWEEIELSGHEITLRIQPNFSQTEAEWLKMNIPTIVDNLASIIGSERCKIFISHEAGGVCGGATMCSYSPHLDENYGVLTVAHGTIVGEEDIYGRDYYWLTSHELIHILFDPFSEEMAKLLNMKDAHEFVIQLGEIVAIRSGREPFLLTNKAYDQPWVVLEALDRDPEIFRKLYDEWESRGRPSLSRTEWARISSRLSPGLFEVIEGRQ